MRYGKLFCFLGLSAIAILGSGLPALSQETTNTDNSEKSETQVQEQTSPASEKDCFRELKEKNNDQEKNESKKENDDGLQSKRVELYYYRNAANVVNILSKLPLKGEGCVTTLPLNELPAAGVGVGRGGGNIILLYGTKPYIENAQRFITSLDLPLPGIDLQLWGVQISSKDPDKLAETMSKVRWRISETRRLLGETLATIEGISQYELQQQNKKEQNLPITGDSFTKIMKKLGYEDAIDGLGGESSILEIFLVGITVDNPTEFYNKLYTQSLANNQDLQPYFDALKNDTNRPPFERTFRSRGLEPDCTDPPQYEKLKEKDENKDLKCEQWQWKERPLPMPNQYFNSSNENKDSEKKREENKDLCEQGKSGEKPLLNQDTNSPNENKQGWETQLPRNQSTNLQQANNLQQDEVSIVDITNNFGRKVLLEFALHYTDFIKSPNCFDPEELQRTASALDELLQSRSDLLQKDIEDFFIKPTLSIIQEIVADDDGVGFAQVGRSTISTLNGVETTVNTSSTSSFQISQSQDLEQLLIKAETLQRRISNFLPTGALGDASEIAETAATGVPVSRLLGLAIAALEQNSTPVKIETGTNLSFTPGISRNLNSAELNIELTVTDPTITPTADGKNVPFISRIGQQTMNTL